LALILGLTHVSPAGLVLGMATLFVGVTFATLHHV
jgi:hypothetical protein